jgi:hypothetical protein
MFKLDKELQSGAQQSTELDENDAETTINEN